LIKERSDIYCDLSAIAKGYAVDDIGKTLERAGVHHYMVEVGGELRVLGRNPDGAPWRLGIQDPSQMGNALYTAVEMKAEEAPLSLATSGDYRNFIEQDGERVSHIFNAQTQQPIDHNVVSVSVLHESCAWADGWATALLILGDENGQCYGLANAEGLAALFLVRDGDGISAVASNKWKEYTAASESE